MRGDQCHESNKAMINKPTEFFQNAEMPTAGCWPALWPDPARALAAMGLKLGMVALDSCVGNGWFTLPKVRIAQHMTATDLDPDMPGGGAASPNRRHRSDKPPTMSGRTG